MEVEKIFKENRCSQCEKMFKTKDQQVIHLLYNHTKWVEVIAAEADMVTCMCGFLVRVEGLDPSDITVLAAYKGQAVDEDMSTTQKTL